MSPSSSRAVVNKSAAASRAAAGAPMGVHFVFDAGMMPASTYAMILNASMTKGTYMALFR